MKNNNEDGSDLNKLLESLKESGIDITTTIFHNIDTYTPNTTEDLMGTEELPESLVEEIMLTIYSEDLGESK